MNYLAYLLKFLVFVPSIAAGVQAAHSAKSVDEKVAVGATILSTATSVAAAVLPDEEAKLATQAGNIAQSILAATVAALHNAAPVVA